MNDTLCDIFGGIGCFVTFWCLGLMFFGISSAVWGALLGLGITGFAFINYD